MRRSLIFIFAVSLAGCMVGPDYRRPTIDIPQTYLYEEKEAQDLVNTAWWMQFQDPVLDNLINEALVNNKDIKIAAANVEKAAGYLIQTRAPLFPQLAYTASGARQRYTEIGAAGWSSGTPNPQNSFQLMGEASWEIDLWGRTRRLSESALADLMASEEKRRGVILTLVADVASTYLQLRGLDEQLAISKRTLNAYAESVRLYELQFQYGQSSQMTVEQARTQYETAAVQIPQIEYQIVQKENAISILLGRNPGPIPRGKSVYELKLPAVPAGVPSQVLENRPDILEAEQTLVAANAQIGAAKALYFPTISLTGNLGLSSGELHNLFKGPARVWNYSGTITGPIFKAGEISGQVEQARAAQRSALHSYEKAIQNAFSDVENALVNREMLDEQLKAQERLVKASREYDRLAKLQFDGGYSPYSTVLQAQQQLFPAELDLAKTRASLFDSLVTIYKAMGGGWVTTAEQLTLPAGTSGEFSSRPCAEELERFCKDVKQGGGRLLECLKKQTGNLSPACRTHVQRYEAPLAAQPAAAK